MKVREIMHRGVEWVTPDTPISTVAKKMRDRDVGAIPVGENDRLIGMITDRDIALRGLAHGGDPARLTARDVMTKGIFWCRDSEDTAEAVHMMEVKKIRRLPVIDENKRMVGMLSLGDISQAAPQRTAAQALKAVSAHHV